MHKLMMKKSKYGFTLVELMIVVAIIGILAVLAIYGVTKYITNAKTSEARNSLGQLAKAAVASYEEERSAPDYVAPGSVTAGSQHQVCAGASATVPAAIANVANKKYQSSQATGADWSIGDKNTGWPCLKFALTEPQYFMYDYKADTATNRWVAKADSAFKGGTTSTLGFSIGGKTAGTQNQMVVVPQIHEVEGPAADPPGL